MDAAKTVILTAAKRPWGPWCEDLFARIPDAADHMAAWRAMVARGEATLLALEQDRAALILRVEDDGAGRWLTVPALAGQAGDLDLVGVVDRLARDLAPRLGCTGLRFWTARPGLARRAEGLGFTLKYVCEARLE